MKKQFSAKRKLGAAVALCLLLQSGTGLAAEPLIDTENLTEGMELSAAASLEPVSATESLSDNYLNGIKADFKPIVGKDQDGYSIFKDNQITPKILTDGKKDKPFGGDAWYVKFPSKANERDENYPYLEFKLKSVQTVNTVKIFAGRNGTTLDDTDDRLNPDKISVFVKKNDGDWKKVNIEAEEVFDNVNRCQLVTLHFPNSEISEIKIGFEEGTGLKSEVNNGNTEGFRIREVELYKDSNVSISPEPGTDPEPKPEPEPEPEPDPDDIEWEGKYDYNVNNNAIFDILNKNGQIETSGGELNSPSCLVDGKRESADGNGSTKWFLNPPSGSEYAEFTLENETVIGSAAVCSGIQKDGITPDDILTDFSVQYMDRDGAWKTAATVSGNAKKLAEVSFEPVSSKKFRIYTDTKTRFRVREIQLNYPDVRCRVKAEKYADLSEITKAVISIKGDKTKISKVEVLINGAVTETFTEKKSEYSAEFTPIPGENSVSVNIYEDYNGKEILVWTENASLYALDIKKDMQAFEADKKGSINKLIKDMKEAGFEITAPDSVSEDVCAMLAEKLSGTYTGDISGMKTLCEDINKYLPEAIMNGTKSGEELIEAIRIYEKIYGIDYKTFEDFGTDAIKICAQMIKERPDTGYESYDAMKNAVLSASAMVEYNTAYAQSLPQVFEKYKSVCSVDISSIEQKYLSATLTKLKAKTVNKYSEIPGLLSEAYAEAKKEVDNKNQNTNNNGGHSSGGGSSSGGHSSGGGTAYRVSSDKVYVTPTKKPIDFNDISEAEWARTAIESLRNNGVLSGDGNGNFRPYDFVTRAEFVKIVVLGMNIPDSPDGCEFGDVSKDDWYYQYAAAAVKSGIIKGDTEKCFRGDEEISREDMAVILYRLCISKNATFRKTDKLFSDEGSVSSYARAAVNRLHSAGLIKGNDDNAFNPKSSTTRAETAEMIYRIQNFVK